MRPVRFSADTLVALLRRQIVATMLQLRAALGDCSPRTVERKLRDIPHHTSYSHGGRFYTLADQPQFDARGLWSFRGIRFSVHGNLLDTAAALVRDSRAGYRVQELDALLQVRCGDALRKLSARARVARERRGGRYWYHAVEPPRGARQRSTRDAWDALEDRPPGEGAGRGDWTWPCAPSCRRWTSGSGAGLRAGSRCGAGTAATAARRRCWGCTRPPSRAVGANWRPASPCPGACAVPAAVASRSAIESNRASHFLRDLQELVRDPARYRGTDPQLHPHHNDQDWLAR